LGWGAERLAAFPRWFARMVGESLQVTLRLDQTEPDVVLGTVDLAPSRISEAHIGFAADRHGALRSPCRGANNAGFVVCCQ